VGKNVDISVKILIAGGLERCLCIKRKTLLIHIGNNSTSPVARSGGYRGVYAVYTIITIAVVLNNSFYLYLP